jgi:hypothetical protein
MPQRLWRNLAVWKTACDALKTSPQPTPSSDGADRADFAHFNKGTRHLVGYR